MDYSQIALVGNVCKSLQLYMQAKRFYSLFANNIIIFTLQCVKIEYSYVSYVYLKFSPINSHYVIVFKCSRYGISTRPIFWTAPVPVYLLLHHWGHGARAPPRN